MRTYYCLAVQGSWTLDWFTVFVVINMDTDMCIWIAVVGFMTSMYTPFAVLIVLLDICKIFKFMYNLAAKVSGK